MTCKSILGIGTFCVALATQASLADDSSDVLSYLEREGLEYGAVHMDDSGALVVADLAYVDPGGARITADALVVRAIDVAALMNGAPPSVFDVSISNLTVPSADFEEVYGTSWPFANNPAQGNVNAYFAMDVTEPVAGSGRLSIDFGTDGIVVLSTQFTEAEWLPASSSESRSGSDASHRWDRLWAGQYNVSISNFTIPESAWASLVRDANVEWDKGPIPLDVNFHVEIDHKTPDIRISVTIDVGIGHWAISLDLRVADWTLAGDAAVFYELALSPLRWGSLFELRHGEIKYIDAGFADSVADFAAKIGNETAQRMQIRLLSDLLAWEDSLTDSGGPTANVARILREIVLNRGHFSGDTLRAAIRPMLPIALADLGALRGIASDVAMRLMGVYITYNPDHVPVTFGYNATTGAHRGDRLPRNDSERVAPALERRELADKDNRIVRWKMASAFPGETVTLGTQGRLIEERIAALSDGTMEFKFFEPGALVPPFEIFDAVSNGSVDVGWSAAGYWAGKIPGAQFFTGVPFGPRSEELLAWMFYGGGQELFEELYHAHNIHGQPCNLLSPEGSGWFREPVETIDDLKGLKMRFFGLGAKVMEKLGVSTQLVAGGDIYPALELGTIDATEFSMPAIDLDLGFHEIAKHYYFPGWHQPISMGELIINLDNWNGLTDWQREIVNAVCKESMLRGLAYSEAI